MTMNFEQLSNGIVARKSSINRKDLVNQFALIIVQNRLYLNAGNNSQRFIAALKA
jgi:hypothetical protein